MRIRFQADANLDPAIWRGLLRREPSIDFAGHGGVVPDGMPDSDVLALAAAAGRVLVTADTHTIPVEFRRFIATHDSPGVVLVPSSRALAAIIEGLLLLWSSVTPEQIRSLVVWLPRVTDRS